MLQTIPLINVKYVLIWIALGYLKQKHHSDGLCLLSPPSVIIRSLQKDRTCSVSNNIFLTSPVIIIMNKLCIINYTRSQPLSQTEDIEESDLAVFGLVSRAWHAGLTQRAGWVWEVIPTRAVGAASVWGGEVCVPQVLSILTLGTWWEEGFSLGFLHTHFRVSHPPPHLFNPNTHTIQTCYNGPNVSYSIS